MRGIYAFLEVMNVGDIRRGATHAMLRGAVKTIPMILIRLFLALFDKKMRGIAYPGGTGVCNQT